MLFLFFCQHAILILFKICSNSNSYKFCSALHHSRKSTGASVAVKILLLRANSCSLCAAAHSHTHSGDDPVPVTVLQVWRLLSAPSGRPQRDGRGRGPGLPHHRLRPVPVHQCAPPALPLPTALFTKQAWGLRRGGGAKALLGTGGTPQWQASMSSCSCWRC